MLLIHRSRRSLFAGIVIPLLLTTGCGGGNNGVKIANAGGSVSYKGAPLAGANVTFMPQKGPLAMAVTDLEGKFKLSTGGMSGCAVGPAKVAVSVSGANDTSAGSGDLLTKKTTSAADFAEQSRKMATATTASQEKNSKKAKSLIPSNYSDVEKSGLRFTVESDTSKNNFKIELKD